LQRYIFFLLHNTFYTYKSHTLHFFTFHPFVYTYKITAYMEKNPNFAP